MSYNETAMDARLGLCIMECQDCGYTEQVWVRHERKRKRC